MKRVLFLLPLFLVMAFAFTPDKSFAQPLLYTGEIGPDTLNASETIYHYPSASSTVATSVSNARRFRDLGDLEILVRSDSLSGATNGVATFQVSYDLAGTLWYDVGTLTINGATAQYYHVEDELFNPTWWRMKFVGTGTQATKIQTVYSFKKRL